MGTIQTLTDLANLVTEYDGKRWLFRGQEKDYGKLQPRIGRDVARKDHRDGSAVAYDAKAERKALDTFRAEVRPYLGTNSWTTVQWLATAQHHGMWTRLLDWTTSPFVAAYFAVKAAGTKGDAVIYGIPPQGPLPEDAEERVFDYTVRVTCYTPAHLTARIPAQKAMFTIHPDPTQDFKPEGLRKWHIPRGRPSWELKLALDTCGFNEASLFPDIDGLADYTSWRYKWDRLP